MADPGEDQMRDMFARFRDESVGDSPGPDLAWVHGLARRRQIARRTTLSVVALAMLAVPAVGYRLLAQEAGQPHETVSPQQVSGAPSERPSEDPSVAVSTSSATVQKAVTKDDLMAATLVIPAWPGKREGCPAGEVDLDRLPPVSREQQFSVGKVVPVDVDRDGDTEAVALFSCGYEGTVDQVLSVGRDDQGALRVMGRVVGSGDADPLMDLIDLRPGRDGAVDVHVGDRIGAEQEYVERQWRSYRWNGRQFAQVDGPRQFTPVAPSTDLGLSVTSTPFGPLSDSAWTGAVTVAVTNAGPNRAPGVWLDLYVTSADNAALARQVKVTSDCTTTDVRADGRLTGVRLVCHQPALADGDNRETTFQVRLPEANGPRALTVMAFVYAEQPGVRMLDDMGGLPNSATLTMAAPTG
jgi:hypothetical protein